LRVSDPHLLDCASIHGDKHHAGGRAHRLRHVLRGGGLVDRALRERSEVRGSARRLSEPSDLVRLRRDSIPYGSLRRSRRGGRRVSLTANRALRCVSLDFCHRASRPHAGRAISRPGATERIMGRWMDPTRARAAQGVGRLAVVLASMIEESGVFGPMIYRALLLLLLAALLAPDARAADDADAARSPGRYTFSWPLDAEAPAPRG